MPEYEEVLGCFLTLDRWFQSVSEDSRALTQLWADEIPTSEDTQNPTSAKSRETIEIDLFRKPKHPFWPPPPWSGAGAGPLHELRLASIQTSPRAVLLDFKQIWLQVSTFVSVAATTSPILVQVEIHSHVIIQVYTQAQWYLEVSDPEQHVRVLTTSHILFLKAVG